MNIWKYHEIKPNNKVNFIMAYNAARRSLLRLEYRLRKIYGKHIPFPILKELLKIHQKLNQMVAAHKLKTPKQNG